MSTYDLRYSGKRWTVVYGAYEGVEKFAIEEIYDAVQKCMPYTVRCVDAQTCEVSDHDHLIVVGTPSNNSLVHDLIARGFLDVPDQSQGYIAVCQENVWNSNNRMIVIAGHDSHGVLYGVQDFYTQVIALQLKDVIEQSELRSSFDQLPDVAMNDYPRIEHRGIWTWGYVIYDYVRFIDNMARAKMNMLTIWNDCPPVNIQEVIDYAHSRGIKIILGFPWGWGSKLDLTSQEDRDLIRQSVLDEYKSHYYKLDIDGIYFQTLTEHNHVEMGGSSVARIVCDFVNDVANDLYEINNDLHIQFGLHATSILEKYEDLKDLDERVTIVWEDAGVIPYSYVPKDCLAEGPEGNKAIGLNSFDKTMQYTKKLTGFRKDTGFAIVPKGWCCIDWHHEFEHHREFILGRSDLSRCENQLDVRMRRNWEANNTLWEMNYPFAIQFYSELINSRSHPLTVTGLIEDGLFEAVIQPSASIFSETIWNPLRDPADIRQRAKQVEYAINSRNPLYHGTTNRCEYEMTS
ncbi:hypothetical protein [Poriferisphaera sp. WC338]|uniref:hypothetical protein n=1 Tax=Poriferisphaera sp. WC338 TaxID=3425129 RepID=UPI003D812894